MLHFHNLQYGLNLHVVEEYDQFQLDLHCTQLKMKLLLLKIKVRKQTKNIKYGVKNKKYREIIQAALIAIQIYELQYTIIVLQCKPSGILYSPMSRYGVYAAISLPTYTIKYTVEFVKKIHTWINQLINIFYHYHVRIRSVFHFNIRNSKMWLSNRCI